LADGEDFDDADPVAKACGQNVAASHACGRLEHALPVHPNAAVLDQLRGKAAGFNDPRIPKPLIEALLFV
jgi:hypothetical protein